MLRQLQKAFWPNPSKTACSPSVRLGTLFGVVALMALPVDAASLRQHVIVQGDQINLGDLFEGLEPSLAEKRITASPAPGRRVILDPRSLDRIARMNKIDWQPTSTLDTVTIERAAQTITTDQIVERLRHDVAEKFDGHEKVTITLDNPSLSVLLPTSVPASFSIGALTVDPTSRRLTATLTAPAEGAAIVETSIAGRINPLIDVPVLAEGRRNGDIIKAEDIIMIETPVDRITPETITKKEELIGKTPKRGMNARALIKIRDVQMPILVKRGEGVVLSMRQGAMTLTVKAKALDDAAKGDIVRVLNTSSNRVLSAMVDGPGAVSIDSTMPAPTPTSTKSHQEGQ